MKQGTNLLALPVPARTNLLKRQRLKLVLIGGDAAALLIGYLLTMGINAYPRYHGIPRSLLLMVSVTFAGLWALRSQGLFLSRVSAVRVVETTRIARACVILAGLTLLIDRVGHFEFQIRYVVLASSLSFVALMSTRSMYRSWVAAARRQGHFCREIVLIGTDDESARLFELFRTHTELGLTVVGVIGARTEAVAHDLGDLWIGDYEFAEALISFCGIRGVVMSTGSLSPTRLNDLIRNLHADGVHLHVATGVAGIDSRRLTSTPLAYEALLYIEAQALSKAQILAKRLLDIVSATVGLVVLSPVIGLVAAAIKIDDRGPIFFRQRRVGRNGREFHVIKFRSMSVDAEARLDDLRDLNQRTGPLFKLDHDPRVTRVGRFIRDSGIDELPQLVNVFCGEMSLVGPRPALPSEVATFPPGLRAREQVLPGITGLWQVEARDKASFEAYRRLDMYYVENWSITLDLMIILNTIEHFTGKVFRTIVRRRPAAIGTVQGAGQGIATSTASAGNPELSQSMIAMDSASAEPGRCTVLTATCACNVIERAGDHRSH